MVARTHLLDDDSRAELRAWLRSTSLPQGQVTRARIVLALDAGERVVDQALSEAFSSADPVASAVSTSATGREANPSKPLASYPRHRLLDGQQPSCVQEPSQAQVSPLPSLAGSSWT